jgi:hypothetical protein
MIPQNGQKYKEGRIFISGTGENPIFSKEIRFFGPKQE